MRDIDELTRAIIEFRDERDWRQFHRPKDLAISLVLEAAELLEHFQWKTEGEIRAHIQSHQQLIGEELADVLYWVLLMSHDLQIDLAQALLDKIEVNKSKYPVHKSKGKHTKYTELP